MTEDCGISFLNMKGGFLLKRKRITALISAAAVAATVIPASLTAVLAEEPTTLEVGADKEYTTISAAVAAAKAIDPQSEAGRVTINVDPGDYEEQVRIEDMSFITLQQTPGTEDDGKVDLHWYYCTGYCAGNTGLDGRYDPKINWSDPRTWSGYEEGDEQFTEYRLGQVLEGVDTISYYDTDGVAHENVSVRVSHLGNFDEQAALVIDSDSTDITVKDFNIVNSIPVMVTEGEKAIKVVPQEDRNADNATSYVLPRRDNLAVCDEDTEPVGTDRVVKALAIENDVEKTKALEALTDLTPEESAYLVRSDKYNERGHAIAINGDRIILEGIRARGNQDSVWVGVGRQYFKNCDLIGGTDYIYGDATVVFDNCLLGAAGMTNRDYGATITAANHDSANPYGYLFYNCTVYNVLDNITDSLYGRPWRQDAQITFYNTKIDDTAEIGESSAGIGSDGWRDMSGNEADKARFYEYGTYNASGDPVDLSGRMQNENGFGTVLGEWQILEYNPRNYFNSSFHASKGEWDPMNFGETYLAEVDREMENAAITVPEGEETTITLPTSSDSNIEFKWESASTNAVVSADGSSIEVIRPAAGEDPIETTVTLYARDKETGFGDKKEIPVTIAATTDTENIFDIPVTISQSTSDDNSYTVTVTKNGALIKSQVIDVSAEETQETISGIPASTDGIAYDVTIVSESNDFTVTVPEDGRTTVTGITDRDVPLTVTAQKLVDDTVTLDINTSAANGDRTYDLIVLAKAAGAVGIENSEVVKVSFDVNVDSRPAENGIVDISFGTPSDANSATPQRFTAFKINQSWEQIDTVNHTQGFSGSSQGPGQCLNISGKFDYTTTHTVSTEIDYKAQTVTVDGSNSGDRKSATPYTFEGFPEGAAKGTLNMGVFSGSETDEWTVSNVRVTYKRLITDDDPQPTPTPALDGEGVHEFPGNITSINGGNQCDDASKYIFTEDADAEIASFFADDTDSTVIKPSLVANYKNYVAGTGNGTHPSVILNAPAGKYRIYYLGYNHGNNITAEVNGNVYTAGAGEELAYRENDESYILKVYTIDIETETNPAVITFDSTDQWLPDLYSIVVVGSSELIQPPSPTPTATATATATADPTATATAEADTDPKIVSAYKDGGNTMIKLDNIDEGVVIGAVYDNDVLVSMKSAEIDGDDITLEGIEADKVFVWESLQSMKPVCDGASVADAPAATPTHEAPIQPTQLPDGTIKIDFSAAGSVPVYTAETGQGFKSISGAYAAEGYEREVAPVSEIEIADGAAAVTENSGDYLRADDDQFPNSTDGGNRNHGGLIYRLDTEGAGAYHLEVEVTDASSVYVAPTGMDASRLTSTSNWDNAGEVQRTASAKWTGNVWTYDFATGEDFVEIEIEPRTLPSEEAPQTVGVKSISIKPLEVNPAGDKPTIHILGDSTQKTYTFNETISGWGQTLGNYFDSDKVNVVNYSMGGRAMKSSYTEGRFDEVLISGKQGDYVFIHSAHNDETTSLNRFSRGAGLYSGDLEANNANYQRWLDMYVEAIKARGMTPVLVTAMPRTGNGRYSESEEKPNGFNPDSPALMRAKAASDPEVGLAELYEGATEYIDSLDANEVKYIYNSYEAGETPAENAANGTSGDGTHYREAASKQWSRIILQSIYDQANAETDTYTDKAIMQELVSLMDADVSAAAQSGDWSAVFPEMASDVSAVGVVPGAQKQSEENYYYRNNIEKALELGLLHKNSENMFLPGNIITVGEFARGAEKAFGLAENTLTNYTRTYDELRGGSAAAETSAELQETGGVSLQSDDSLELTEGQVTITVEQPAGGTVTVYNESAFDSLTVDMPGDPEPNAVISDNDYFTLTAPETIESKSDSGAAFAEAPDIDSDGIVTRNSDSKETYITAKADGKLIAYVRGRADRKFALKDVSSDTVVEKSVNDAPLIDGDSSNVYGTVTFDITEGTTYQLYARSFGGILFGVRYESSDYPQSTVSLAVNSGDTVRVAAVADENYEYDTILVNGEPVNAAREYTFTAEADTTVSARFTAEPELVLTAPVASDAALTREVMGAILYDAYTAVTDETVKANIEAYMAQNGSVPSPDDPNYDPNLTYEGTPYIPLTGWGALTDTDSIEDTLYQKVKASYNWGLIRTESGIGRSTIANGTELEPKTQVTRAKAAKSLVFAFLLTQPQGSANQKLPDGINHAAEAAEIVSPNGSAPSVPVI